MAEKNGFFNIVSGVVSLNDQVLRRLWQHMGTEVLIVFQIYLVDSTDPQVSSNVFSEELEVLNDTKLYSSQQSRALGDH